MNAFIQRHRDHVIGVLSGFDRLVFRGTLRGLAYEGGMAAYLSRTGILLKEFGEYALAVSTRVKQLALDVAHELGRPHVYLTSPKIRKDELAHQIASRDGVREGLVCTFTAVEPCRSFEIHRNREKQLLQLKLRDRKCLFVYHYLIHPVFGFMGARIQTWFPFSIQICLNGREWLARQMDTAGISYTRRDNTFTWVEDFPRAQQLLSSQLDVAWPHQLDGLALLLNPLHDSIFASRPLAYYWSAHQTEWATDVAFRSREDLLELYPALLHHGITTFGCADVMRFLGHGLLKSGQIPDRFHGQVVSNISDRYEGTRLKHWVDHNAQKLYDKWSVLRAENVMNFPSTFKVFRTKEGDPDGAPEWRPLRRGIADLKRRADLSQAANDRYLEAFASVESKTPIGDLVLPTCQPVTWKGRRVRPLNPWAPADLALLQAVSRGDFTLNGFRNRDLRALLFPSDPRSPKELRRQSAAITRKIRLLRAHHLITKVPKTHRYQVSAHGRLVLTALLTAHQADTAVLTKLAA